MANEPLVDGKLALGSCEVHQAVKAFCVEAREALLAQRFLLHAGFSRLIFVEGDERCFHGFDQGILGPLRDEVLRSIAKSQCRTRFHSLREAIVHRFPVSTHDDSEFLGGPGVFLQGQLELDGLLEFARIDELEQLPVVAERRASFRVRK